MIGYVTLRTNDLPSATQFYDDLLGPMGGKRALSLGAADEGPNGPRMPGFYAGYFRDPDGNKLSFSHMG